MELWTWALRRQVVRSIYVAVRNGRRYLIAEKSLGFIHMSWRTRRYAAAVRRQVLVAQTDIRLFLLPVGHNYSVTGERNSCNE